MGPSRLDYRTGKIKTRAPINQYSLLLTQWHTPHTQPASGADEQKKKKRKSTSNCADNNNVDDDDGTCRTQFLAIP